MLTWRDVHTFTNDFIAWLSFIGIALAVYGKVKALVPSTYTESTFADGTCSFFGYGVASAITNPFDVVKTRRQVQASNPGLFNYKSGMDCFQKIVKHEGPIALMDGVVGRVIWLTPRCGIALTMFNQIYSYLESKDSNDDSE